MVEALGLFFGTLGDDMTLDVGYSYIVLDSGSEEAQIIDLQVAKNRKEVAEKTKRAYISDYVLNKYQLTNFNHSIPTGPVVGAYQIEIAWPTPAPTVRPTVPPADVTTGAPTAFDVEL